MLLKNRRNREDKMQYHFYAYNSPYGREYAGNGIPHRFQSKRDRDRWIDDRPENRDVLNRDCFKRAAMRFGWFVEHENGDDDGFQADCADLDE